MGRVSLVKTERGITGALLEALADEPEQAAP